MPPPLEETLDPSNWDELRALGHRMVDDMMDYLEGVRERPVWRPVPAETRAQGAYGRRQWPGAVRRGS